MLKKVNPVERILLRHEKISEKVVTDLFDGVETDLEEKALSFLLPCGIVMGMKTLLTRPYNIFSALKKGKHVIIKQRQRAIV